MLLAPVVRERKGEHLQLFDQLRAQGFVRVRVDGRCTSSTPCRRWPAQKHTIEAVVDRFKVRARTSSSAWPSPSRPRSSWARAGASRSRWTTSREHLFSARSPARSAATRCRSWSRGCSRSTTRSAPAPTCDGLGVAQFFDPARVVVPSRT
jgi:excinuclease ABC subunit A